MHYSFKYLFIASNLFGFIYIFQLYQLQSPDSKTSYVTNVVTGSFIALEDNKTFIISPYYDPRGDSLIRILAIVHKTVKNLYCLFHCKQNGYVNVKAKIDIVKDHFGFPYETAHLLCGNPSECDYVYMSVHTNSSKDVRQIPTFRIQKDPIREFSANFSVCISAFYGQYNNVLQTIQAIEMYKLLGASKIIIYNNSCHDNVDKVLRHYIQEGDVDVIPWPIDTYLRTSRKWKYVEGLDSDIGYYGQIASLNDCIYRNMYKSNFILLNDIDEIILPVKYWDWSSLMESLQKKHPEASVFRFENHAFPSSVEATGSNRWNHVPGINILQYPYREPSDRYSIKPRKMIINPRKVIQTSVHHILKAEGYSTDVSSQDAILFHCKHKRNKKIPDKDLIKDDIVLKYSTYLEPNVDKVVQKLFPQP
ncbi:beta-1,4-galactosyltransferase galt-1-like [Bufo gargarizans]|uniref:beta-1,4-galactosyltransferase galt-1-like n=1 Tax=Bufo gargarizans TaxID=30331 RepID=UPI001CF4F19A|nr:beta-1,4-galactosyltransferase galt-1-like [Bufo gargarizans]XP_044155228.1 beta-1,4-galactosyltransferase galt-1-like [Bufo gargarizans]